MASHVISVLQLSFLYSSQASQKRMFSSLYSLFRKALNASIPATTQSKDMTHETCSKNRHILVSFSLKRAYCLFFTKSLHGCGRTRRRSHLNAEAEIWIKQSASGWRNSQPQTSRLLDFRSFNSQRMKCKRILCFTQTIFKRFKDQNWATMVASKA